MLLICSEARWPTARPSAKPGRPERVRSPQLSLSAARREVAQRDRRRCTRTNSGRLLVVKTLGVKWTLSMISRAGSDNKRLLVLLDNFEQVIEAAPTRPLPAPSRPLGSSCPRGRRCSETATATPRAVRGRNLVRQGPHGTGVLVAFPPKRDIRGVRTPAEGMSMARMVVIRCFGVSGVPASRFLGGEIVRARFRDAQDLRLRSRDRKCSDPGRRRHRPYSHHEMSASAMREAQSKPKRHWPPALDSRRLDHARARHY